MKRTFLLFSILILSFFAFAQINPKGNGVTYTLSEMAISDPAWVQETSSGNFLILQNIYLLEDDTLLLKSTDQSITISDNLTLTFYGTVVCEPRTELLPVIGDTTGANPYRVVVENAEPFTLSQLHFQHGYQVLLSGADIFIEQCEFSGFANGAVNYMNCNPVIRNCYFHDNQKAAITSAVNTNGSPHIIGNTFYNNDLSNANIPQINLGPGAESIILIDSNVIEGVAQNMSGGFAIMNMGSSNTILSFTNNIVKNNRYGYTQNGTHINAYISDNHFINNNLETNPNNGGSGISIYGSDTTCAATIRHNEISGNLWGVTAIYNHSIDMGTADDPGENILSNNGNGGVEYELYNNAFSDMSAVGNCWGHDDPDSVEAVIYHKTDDPSLGLVTYMPLLPCGTSVETYEANDVKVYPNPAANGTFHISQEGNALMQIQVFSIEGQLLFTRQTSESLTTVNASQWPSGLYLVQILQNGYAKTMKILIP
ncbi:MAG: T9SS type A sorting domain-containing protein [Bacteroidales bacterium]|nr:T9SS type A sorting domain-containing protein [Bacteroidales bacterium]